MQTYVIESLTSESKIIDVDLQYTANKYSIFETKNETDTPRLLHSFKSFNKAVTYMLIRKAYRPKKTYSIVAYFMDDDKVSYRIASIRLGILVDGGGIQQY